MEHITSPYDIVEQMRNLLMWMPPPSRVCNFPRNKKMEAYLYSSRNVSKSELYSLGVEESYLKPVDLRMRSRNAKNIF